MVALVVQLDTRTLVLGVDRAGVGERKTQREHTTHHPKPELRKPKSFRLTAPAASAAPAVWT